MKDFEDKFKDGGTLNTISSGLDRYIDYDVIDDHNHKIGTLNSLWVDRDGHPLFLGIKTGWVFGKTHVVPTGIAKVNQSSHCVRLPFSEDTIRGAPTFEADKGLAVSDERDVYRYFHMSEPAAVSEARPDLATRQTSSPAAKAPPAESGFKAAAAAAATAPLTPPTMGPSAGIASQPSAPARPEAANEGRMVLSEETLKVGKKIVDAGGVRLRKIIRTETASQPVELNHEDIVIERVPASGAAQPSAVEAFVEKEIYIALHREEPVVQKESRVREEVRARKQPQVEKRTVSDSIRKEDVEVVKDTLQPGNVQAQPM